MVQCGVSLYCLVVLHGVVLVLSYRGGVCVIVGVCVLWYVVPCGVMLCGVICWRGVVV